jgi:hypothetical protein
VNITLISINLWDFLASCGTVSFSRRTVPCDVDEGVGSLCERASICYAHTQTATEPLDNLQIVFTPI